MQIEDDSGSPDFGFNDSMYPKETIPGTNLEQENKNSESTSPESFSNNGVSEENIGNATAQNEIEMDKAFVSTQKKRREQEHWSKIEVERLNNAPTYTLQKYGTLVGHWKEIADYVGTRDLNQCCIKYKNGLSRVRKPSKEDKELMKYYISKGLPRKKMKN